MFGKWSSFTDLVNKTLEVAEANIDKMVGIEDTTKKNPTPDAEKKTTDAKEEPAANDQPKLASEPKQTPTKKEETDSYAGASLWDWGSWGISPSKKADQAPATRANSTSSAISTPTKVQHVAPSHPAVVSEPVKVVEEPAAANPPQANNLPAALEPSRENVKGDSEPTTSGVDSVGNIVQPSDPIIIMEDVDKEESSSTAAEPEPVPKPAPVTESTAEPIPIEDVPSTAEHVMTGEQSEPQEEASGWDHDIASLPPSNGNVAPPASASVTTEQEVQQDFTPVDSLSSTWESSPEFNNDEWDSKIPAITAVDEAQKEEKEEGEEELSNVEPQIGGQDLPDGELPEDQTDSFDDDPLERNPEENPTDISEDLEPKGDSEQVSQPEEVSSNEEADHIEEQVFDSPSPEPEETESSPAELDLRASNSFAHQEHASEQDELIEPASADESSVETLGAPAVDETPLAMEAPPTESTEQPREILNDSEPQTDQSGQSNQEETPSITEVPAVPQSMPTDSDSDASKVLISHLMAQLSTMQKKLAQREEQLREKGHQHALVLDENMSLKEAISRAPANSPSSEIESLTQEFSDRLGSLERKYQAAARERDMFKKQLAKQIDMVGSEEKDRAISELKQEGEKLQEKLLNLEQTLKKMRQTKREDDKALATLKAELETSTSSLTTATARIQSLSIIEKKYEQTIDGMKNVSDATSHQLVEYQQQAKTAQEKLGDVQSALETAWNDISKLKKTIQEQSAQHSHEQKQLEQRLRDEYHSSLRQQAAEEAKKESVLKQTILELRGMLDSSESFSSSREEDYQRRISTQQQTIDELEGRLAHMSQSTTQTTKPLLRQINELQMQLQAKDETFHAVERSLRLRTAEEETRALTLSQEKNELREAAESLKKQLIIVKLDLENRDAKLGDAYQQVETLRQEASEKASQISQMKSTLSSSKSELDKITHEKVQIEHQVTNLRAKLADKESQLSQQMAMNQKLASQYQVLASTSTVPIVAPAVPSAPEEPVASHVKKSVSTDSLASLSSPLARSKLLTGTSAASMEMYNATLFQKDGEISQLQATIEILTSQKKQLEAELVKLANSNEEMQVQLTKLENIESQKQDLEGRYMAALEIIGERSERVNEIETDVDEWKVLYKNQIIQLCEQIEHLTQENKRIKSQQSK